MDCSFSVIPFPMKLVGVSAPASNLVLQPREAPAGRNKPKYYVISQGSDEAIAPMSQVSGCSSLSRGKGRNDGETSAVDRSALFRRKA